MSSNADYPGSFSKMPQMELEELVKRLKNLLENPKVLERLADKGERVKTKISAAESEIKRRESVLEAGVQLAQMSIRDPSDDQEGSCARLDENTMPKFCSKLEKYERRRNSKTKFKPFQTLVRPPDTNPGRLQTSESVAEARQEPPIKEISTLSIKDSLKIAASRQALMKNLFREDATIFSQNPEKKIQFIAENRPPEFSGYRDHREEPDSDDDGLQQDRILNGLEELD